MAMQHQYNREPWERCMLNAMAVRAQLLAIHGFLAVCLGLVLLYIGVDMRDFLAEVVDIAVAIVLFAAALIFAGISDWFAAFGGGLKHLHRFVFYALAGTALALAGAFLVVYPRTTLKWLVLLASAHALSFGVFALLSARKASHHRLHSRSLYILGAVSLLFSALMATLIVSGQNRSTTLVLSAYVCFVGMKMLVLAWRVHRSPNPFDGLSIDPR